MLLDIHSHLIPNIDDGSPDMETSLNMLKESVDSGVTDIILTPHHYRGKYEHSLTTIKAKYNEFLDAAKAAGINANIYLGMEICVSHLENYLEKVKSGDLLTLNGSKTMLIEFSLHSRPHNFEEIVYDIKCSGYDVIIAHVERYSWIKFDDIEFLKNEGAYIQVNADSLLGIDCTFREKSLARKVMKKKLLDYIGSDMHSFRRTHLAKALKKFDKKGVYNNPSLVNL